MSVTASVLTQQLNPLNSVLGSTLVALLPLVFIAGVIGHHAGDRVAGGDRRCRHYGGDGDHHLEFPGGADHPSVGNRRGDRDLVHRLDRLLGVVIYNVLVETGAFAHFRHWLVTQATADIRVQAILMAWALGALLEGLVGFGYPWAVVAPILVGLGVTEIDAIRVAAIGNNAPVSYGALGAPIIALATVTGVPLLSLSASVGRIVAILALLPPWILVYPVTGRRGLRGVWPLPVVGSLAYVLGQFPTSQFLGPTCPT
jgi:lactate permease